MQVTGEGANVTFNAPYNDVTGTQNNHYTYHSNVISEVDLGPSEKILRRLRPANMDASHRTECLEDTRTDILDFIMDWAIHPTGDQNVLCLHGVAGSGKSTIATTVANRLRQQGLLGAFVFCERDIAHRNDPLLVVRTIAYQIGLHDEKLGAAISSVIEKYPSVSEFSLPSQFEQLLANILPKVLITAEPSEEQIANERHSISALSSQFQQLLVNILPKFYTAVIPNERPKFVVVVLDALDECGTPGKRDVLLKVLAELTNGIFCLRFIITTRPEIDIQSALSFRPHICMQELIISSQSNTKDILTYFKTRLSQKQRQTSYLKGNDDWPGEEKLQSLVMRASGLFIWATTAATFITQGYNPDSHLATILSGSYSSKSEGALDDLYQTALRCTGDWDDIEFVEDFRSVIGIVLVAQQPLTPDAIDQLRGNSGNHPPCAHIISLLACLVHLRPVRLVHPSFADFLFTHSRCSQKYWLFDHDTLHRALAIQCINHLHRALKQNTCNLTLSPDPVNEHLSEATKYACKHWVEHFVKVNSADRDFLRALEVFLFQHLLHWVEALSILRFSRYAVGLLQRLYSWLVISVAEPQLLQLINDGVRFVQRYANLIETHPLLIYASALPFTPPDTLLYQTFHDPRVYPTSWGLVEQSWSPLLQVLSGHWDSVTSVAYSPDGHRVVSGSGDGEVRVWDVTSGTEAFPPLTDHWLRVNSVAFSPDGARIVSCSHDQIIRRWDASSGLQVLPPMRGHTHRVNSVVYSPDGRLVISGSDDKTVRVWDASSGAEVRPPLQGHTNSIFSVSCSQTCIASGAVDGRIRVWDIASGLEVAPSIKGHTKAVSSVAFSPNGDFLVSGSLDGAIRLWDINSGDQIPHAFEGHSASVNSVAFSPDNAHIVSGSGDKTIRVWSVATGAELMPRLLYGNAAIKAVAFSPDGTRIVSGSSGMIVQVWDATSRASVPFSKGHTKSVNSIAFSADGSRLVSGSYDRTVCVWNAASGTQLLPPLRRNSDWTGSVAFSEDGCYIFMKDAGHVEYVWDATSGTRIHGKEPVAAMDLTGELDLDVIRGWITDRVTGEYLSKLPSTSYIYNQCSHGRSLAAGQQSGDVFVMHFPPRP